MKRHPDGTWRNTRQPLVMSERVRRARWIEAETIHLKRMGFCFEAFAEHLNRIAHGHEQPAVALPENVTFPPDYTITRQACHKACRAAIAREPALEVGALRKIDHARSEEMSKLAARDPQGQSARDRNRHQGPQPRGENQWLRRAKTARNNHQR